MAVQIDLSETNFGISVDGAYARIVDVYGGPAQVQYRVAVYASEAARKANAEPLETQSYYISRNAVTDAFFAGLYADLKTQVRFAGAGDV